MSVSLKRALNSLCAVSLAVSALALAKDVVTPAPINVSTSTAQMVTVPQTIAAYGRIEAIQSVDLSFEVSGHIQKIIKRSGRVSAGDIIVTLNDDTDQAQLAELQADLELDKSNYQRALALKSYGGIAEAQVDADRATVIKDQAKVDQQQALIAKKKLSAPFDGVLGDFLYSVGAYVNAGQPVVSLVQEAPLKVQFSVPADFKPLIEIGQSVEVSSHNIPDKTFTGLVNFVSPQIDLKTGTLTIEAQVPNENFALTPGLFVDTQLILNPNRQLLMVPDVAVMSDVLGQYVFRIKGNAVEKVYVKIGIVAQGFTQVLSGLKEGDQIVVAGQQKLNDGDKINIVPGLISPHQDDLKPASPLPSSSSQKQSS